MKHQDKLFKYLLLFVGILFYTQAQAQRYVDASATGANNGTSWTDAYTSLQSAISGATAGTQIYVAKGTYKPTNGTNRNTTFQIPSGVEIYGGFSGKETRVNQVLLDARDFIANETILSGDLNGDDNVTGTFPTLVYGNYADNSVHLIYTRNVSNATRLDGFTIKGGNANDGSASFDYGVRAGGWYNNGSTGGVSQPTVANCIFTRNIGSEGGAMTNFGCCGGNANATIINCSFTQNQAAKGGAIYNDACCGGRANSTVTNCSFSQNRAINQGGGIYNEGVAGGGARATVTNSVFWENAGTRKSWFNASGGAVTASYTLVEEAAFTAGTANNGNNLFNQDPLFVNAAIGNLNLQATSPMINIGNNAAIPTDITLDAGNSSRVRATTVDLGAFETCPSTSAEINIQGGTPLNNIVDGAGIPDILVSNNTDFGLVPVTRTITYTIRNTGGAVLNISSILSSNTAEYVVSNIPTTVAAGGTATFDVTFNPIACGDNNATIVVNTDDCDEGIYNFVVQGIGGNPEIDVQGNAVSIVDGDVTPVLTDDTDFGNVVTNRTVTYTIQNTGSLALDINSIAITGANAADFVLSGITPPTSVAASGSTTFDVVFTPSTIGIKNATITINNNDCDESVYNFSIKGRGIVVPEINLQGNGNNIVSGAGTTSETNDTDFGDVVECLNSTKATNFTIRNTGSVILNITGIAVSGTNAGDFVVSSIPATVAAAGSETFTITFNPSATGNRVALVTVSNNDSDEGTYTFAINGNGTVDTTDPVIPVLTDINEECSSTPTAPTTTDICAGTITGTTTTTFPITAQGTTVVTWTFDDGNGNSITADQDVIIDDTTDPVIPVLADINEECSSTPTAPTTTDICAGTITGTTTTIFPITAQGTTVVTWTFDDGNGNSITADQNVIINDITNPTITAPSNITANTDTGICTASGVALGTPTGSDNCGTPTFTNNAPAIFPIGNTTVTWTADDGNGNTTTVNQTVTVSDSKEIDVLGNAVSIVDGDVTSDTADNTDFGNTTSRTVTYTIENTGTEVLAISSIVSSGTNAGDFVVSSIPTSVVAGGNATFDVTFTPSALGTRTAIITVNNNDCDEAVYDFAVEGSNISSGDVLLVRTGIYYPTIQEGVDVSVDTDTLVMTVDRIYPENVLVDKTLTFQSNATTYQDVSINQIEMNGLGKTLTIDGNMGIIEVLNMEEGDITVTTAANFALRSTTGGTALVINDDDSNTVIGNVIMERYLSTIDDLGGTNGRGYHLFSSPFSDATVSQFGDDMSLVLTTAYNTAAEPAFTRPFPTFFQYEENNAGATTSAYFNPFISNYKVPTATDLTVVRGYQANIATGETVDLSGILNNGNKTITVTNNGGGFSQEGYNLIGNPYPSPIDWEEVLITSVGVEDAIYIDIPVNQYQGVFAEYVNGVPNNGGKKEIASMQGFFVRTLAGGTVNMTNDARLTADTRFFKTTETQNVKEGLVRVALKKGNSLDETTIYFQNGATSSFDGKYDAAKLHKMNSVHSTLYSYNENAETTEYFAINGLGSFDSNQKLSLAMNILTEGEYEITLRSMKYFHSKHELYLYDSLTDSLHNLRAEGDYKFAAKKGNEVKRFVLLFKTDANKNFFTDEKVVVYPNPTSNSFSYSLKTNREGNYTIRLFDATGRIILEESKIKEGAFLEGTINLEKHSSGLYLLQVSDSEKTTTVRVVKE
ncbi:HYR domain-containing protein [Bernardetia litoralis DSM 6794]|uniref:HYR domain-containing protein n=1 Tax=Bernardetia litoralis (strain ATCC 23117 / DSM 6794 / NBRC 15988 / NCIMB 1366 / Fx l1 / Sio-4) TaxID=880071 RepID=I4AHK9_BERLS|nr:choice-of-anchor D domain-containing protein [Bernardetia litoralis]AFM03444.1 HYR domain-containing protein [Bernardetia litoralis DSM 6794]